MLSAVKMTWLRREMTEVYDKAAKMLGVQDLAIHTLWGEFITDESLASKTNLLNIYSKKWNDELLEIFSVDTKHLCELVPAGTVCGTTSVELEQQAGIPENTRVITAGGDQQCAALHDRITPSDQSGSFGCG